MNTVSTPNPGASPNNTHVPAAPVATRLKIASGTGIFLGLAGFNHSASAQYIQLHYGTGIDGTSGPADTRAPQFVFKVAAGAGFSFGLPFRFTGSLWVCNSSSRDTLTAGSADCSFIATEA
jgi:hypothetical protein